MEDARPRHTKPRFYNLAIGYSLNIYEIAQIAQVSNLIMNDLFLGKPVPKSDALKVLAVVSAVTGSTWNLDNTQTPIITSYYQHFLEFKSPTIAEQEAEKLTVLSHLGWRTYECTLIFYTRDKLRDDETGALFTVSYPQRFSLNVFVDRVFELKQHV